MTQQTTHIERGQTVATSPVAPTQAPVQPVEKPTDASDAPALHRWTVEEFEAGIERGVIEESDAVELLDGYITEKMSINTPHAFATDALSGMLYTNLAGKGYAIGIQNPVKLSETSRPEPDLRVAKGPLRQYLTRIPTADDILWLGEVADSSIDIDRVFKLPMYAVAGIPEYWIININASQIECNTDPQPDGTYDTKRTYKKGETIQHDLLGEIVVAELFGD